MQIKRSLKKKHFKASFKSADVFSKSNKGNKAESSRV